MAQGDRAFAGLGVIAGGVTPDEMRAAQGLTGGAMALWLLAGVVPAMRPYARTTRAAVLVAYLLGCAGFVIYLLAR